MTGYRPDIDGLRAVAVMPVICFHAGLSGFSGGYVGVDVFFVISGYLITSILLGDFARGRYSIASFYERRARRILPALLTVLAFCLVAGYLVMPPFLYSEMAWGVAAVALFSSNVLFWQKSGYFEEPTDLNPLIHTWSLGVEEQFYIGFPILLWFLVRRGERVTGYTLLVLCAVSFVAAEIASRYWPSANFYLLPFRGWELAIGSLLALWQRRADPQVEVPGRAPVLAQGAGVAGLGLIAIAVHTFDAATPFPGVYALLPVIGTALLIWSGRHGTVVARLLSARLLVWIGLISYSLYLWHQPLFAFARLMRVEPPTLATYAVLTAMSFGLAWLSWRFVEQPFRQRERISRVGIFRWSAGASAFVLCCAVGVLATSGMQNRISGHAYADVMAFQRDDARDASWEYVESREGALADTVVVGDSHAKDMFNALSLGGCAPPQLVPLISNELCEDLPPGSSRYRSCVNAFDFPEVAIERADKVILAPSWASGQVQALPDLVARLRSAGTQVLIVDRTPTFEDVPLVTQRLAWWGRPAWDTITEAVLDTRSLQPNRTNARLDRIARGAGVPLVARESAVCPRGHCQIFGSEREFYLYDRAHWTLAGAERFGRRLCRDVAVRHFLTSPANRAVSQAGSGRVPSMPAAAVIGGPG